jgi:glyceraldehyde 3-phosphate dehydrogenase
MGTRIAINGFGRIGRCVARLILSDPSHGVDLVAVNDLTEPDALAYLFEFDSIHGRFRPGVRIEGDHFIVGQHQIRGLSEKDPTKLPWKELGIDVVLECTGRFRTRTEAYKHVTAGAKRVIISAPPKDEVDGIFCVGLNDSTFDPAKHVVISNASCTTNCLAPLLKVLDEKLGVQKANMITVHSYTADQALVDQPHKGDYRRGRAAALSMVPTSSGVSRALASVLPSLKGKFDGSSIRVPTADVSIVCLTALVSRNTTKEEVNGFFQEASTGSLKGILGFEERPLVSSDYIGDPRSSIVDAKLTGVVDGNLVEVQSWYDNEWGYSARMVDLIRIVSKGG